ncbi:MAG: HAD family hydrolase, partial [Chloroflexi bacterium]|nr:HAD family hydrolase [Chloroflexota bacterium]
AVVGDTVADLLMARRAGAGLCVGVLSGVGDPALLAAHADVVLRSIDEIGIGERLGSVRG